MRYTLSEAAYLGLRTLLIKPKPTTQALPVLTDSGVVYHKPLHVGQVEGIANALNHLANMPPTTWLDTRPDHVRRSHELQLQYTNDCRTRWAYIPLEEDIAFLAGDDTPWDKLSSNEQMLRLSLPSQRKRRDLSLRQEANVYYAKLAMLHKMETASLHHGTTQFASACLEAIGIGWLTPPLTASDIPRNPNKARVGFGPPATRQPHGNRQYKAWEMTTKRMSQALQPIHIDHNEEPTQ